MSPSKSEIESTKNLAEAIVQWLIALEEGREQRRSRRANDLERSRAAQAVAPPTPVPAAALAPLPEPKGPRLLRTKEAVQYLGIGVQQMWQLSAPRGPIPVVKFGKSVRYQVDDLEEFIRTCRVKPWKSPGTRR